ncbi:MAG: histidine triad nucleotide-binding protein [Spirochaetaceae bacterium]|jgi:histidine triad (HIT) family protein|nr:histidine triad nucleotide-binding protein [Spirochaetaceae bacterium]
MNDCIFCQIAAGIIPAAKIYEDAELIAFNDLNPQAPVHFLVIPKKHINNLMEAEHTDIHILGKLLYTAQTLAVQLGCEQKGARFVINCKDDGGQTVNHLHIHVLAGRALAWPPG